MAVNSVRHGFLCNNSGLAVFMHGVISLSEATYYDKCFLKKIEKINAHYCFNFIHWEMHKI